MNIERPELIRRGEQVGLRLDIYNYWNQDMEVKNLFNKFFEIL